MMAAERYEVMVDDEVADEAKRLLAEMRGEAPAPAAAPSSQESGATPSAS
jgi:hypothetical protein